MRLAEQSRRPGHFLAPRVGRLAFAADALARPFAHERRVAPQALAALGFVLALGHRLPGVAHSAEIPHIASSVADDGSTKGIRTTLPVSAGTHGGAVHGNV